MEEFLEFLAVEDCEYEVKDGTVMVLDTLSPVEAHFENVVIPENTDFTEGLDLEYYEGEIQLSETLKVGVGLDLSNTSIKRLPSNLTIYDNCSVYLNAHKIENVSYRENCGFGRRTIFAFWANNDFLIAAGCFAGTYSEFVDRVNDEYRLYNTLATKYKRSARDCISELAEKLSKPDPFKKATAN